MTVVVCEKQSWSVFFRYYAKYVVTRTQTDRNVMLQLLVVEINTQPIDSSDTQKHCGKSATQILKAPPQLPCLILGITPQEYCRNRDSNCLHTFTPQINAC